MYPRRPLLEAFDNEVDVVEILHAPTDQLPNVWHLRVVHMVSSVTPSAFLIQHDGDVVDEFWQHDDVVTVMVKLSPQVFA